MTQIPPTEPDSVGESGDSPTSTEPDDSAPDLAMALDAVLDEVQDALATGDVATATALTTAAEATSDALLVVLGVPDADDSDDAGAPDVG